MDSLKAGSLKRKVAVRVLFSVKDYRELKRLAEIDRSDVSTLIRRAVARCFFVPTEGNNITPFP